MNYNRKYITVIAILIIQFIALKTDAAGEDKRLAVIGVKNEINEPEWDNQLIGYGLSHLLLQELFNTGGYIPVEDNPEIIKEIDRLIASLWKERSFYSSTDAEQIAKQLKCQTVAYAKITDFSVKRKRGFAGPFSKSSVTVEVEIEVHLKESEQPVKISKGKGEASTGSTGLFFKIRENKIYFDETTVGKAAEKAVINAVKGLN